MLRKMTLTMVCCLLLASTCFAANPIGRVRSGTFNQCTYRSIDNAVSSGFSNPNWTSGEADDGQIIVNVEGVVTWSGQRYRAVMQFGLLPNNKIHVNGLTLNGKLMNSKFKEDFIRELCR